eukprot:1443062-Prymnesium_polylepis.1
MGWKAFAVLYDDEDEYSSAMTDQLLVDARPLQLQLRATASVRRASGNPYEEALNSLQSSEVNIFVAVLYNQDILGVLKLAKDKSILGAGTVWLLSDAATVSGAMQYASTFGLDSSTAMNLLDGMFSFMASPRGTSGYARYTAELQTQNISECENDIFN